MSRTHHHSKKFRNKLHWGKFERKFLIRIGRISKFKISDFKRLLSIKFKENDN